MAGNGRGAGGCHCWLHPGRGVPFARVPRSSMAVLVSKSPSMCRAPRGHQAEGWRMPEGTRAAQPLDPSIAAGQRSRGCPGACPRRGGRAGRAQRWAGAGGGPPLQTLTLFSQVRRQFPWKQPGAETGTRIQKCEALSSSLPSWIPAPRGPGRPAGCWPWGTHAAHSVSGCRAGPPGHPAGLGCSYALARCSTHARCAVYGDVPGVHSSVVR